MTTIMEHCTDGENRDNIHEESTEDPVHGTSSLTRMLFPSFCTQIAKIVLQLIHKIHFVCAWFQPLRWIQLSMMNLL